MKEKKIQQNPCQCSWRCCCSPAVWSYKRIYIYICIYGIDLDTHRFTPKWVMPKIQSPKLAGRPAINWEPEVYFPRKIGDFSRVKLLIGVARSFEEHMIFSTFGLVENWVTNKFVGVFPSKGTTCWGKLRYAILDEKPLNHLPSKTPILFRRSHVLMVSEKWRGIPKIPRFHFDTKMY